jgi:hypothetical protein
VHKSQFQILSDFLGLTNQTGYIDSVLLVASAHGEVFIDRVKFVLGVSIGDGLLLELISLDFNYQQILLTLNI